MAKMKDNKKEQSLMEKGIAAVRAVKGMTMDATEAALKPIRDAVPKIRNRHGEIGEQLEGRKTRMDKAIDEQTK